MTTSNKTPEQRLADLQRVVLMYAFAVRDFLDLNARRLVEPEEVSDDEYLDSFAVVRDMTDMLLLPDPPT